METKPYGATRDGRPVTQYTLKNQCGVELRCINYGCRLTHLFMPDKNGVPGDVVLGFDGLAGYEGGNYHGAFVGRYANRIEGAVLDLDGKRYELTRNNGANYLHGSFHEKVFAAEVIGDNSISFTYTSPSGEDGFPGELWVAVVYTLTDENELVMDFRAVAREDTVINLTNHAYFNLSAGQSPTVDDHLLWLGCSTFLEAGGDICPTGRVLEVAGGAFDFTKEKPLGRDMAAADPQLAAPGGYDHCFVVDKMRPEALAHAATLTDPASGRTLRVYTTQPAVQLYGGQGMQGEAGKGGRPMGPRSGMCLEAQHYPCSPSHPEFPSTLLRAGDKYHTITVLQFGTAT